MKKLILSLLIAAMAVTALTACSSSTQSAGEGSAAESGGNETEEYVEPQYNQTDSQPDEDTANENENETEDITDEETTDSETEAEPAEINEAFVGSWSPYAAYDESGEKVSLKSIFGDSFSFGGTITFNSDGSFESNLTNEEGKQSGSFTTDDATLSLVYSDGQEVTMTLTGYPNSPTLEQQTESDGVKCTVYYTT
ncbi:MULTISPECIES: hypothetical protein [unclassified Ruminococcus]|uniref:hypothetical protein n=1 Tax=unclassified Ruminococcus TaxID=2608920 RepID=UPI00210EB264|nr:MULTISPECIES: hypothetical protein [unclassified Ruminococcus]MCQ4023180.1 hypothetical protein [Ruminococcus sp. zg-924]MCQ4115398.1 hypothetical protein [Ruminococcus sp. zg-921]